MCMREAIKVSLSVLQTGKKMERYQYLFITNLFLFRIVILCKAGADVQKPANEPTDDNKKKASCEFDCKTYLL